MKSLSYVMSEYPRYAIYYVPAADSALGRYGAECLGYDAFLGQDVVVPPELIATAPDWADLTADARRYGFHATLKAPFSLAQGKTEADLVSACVAFAQQARPIPIIVPTIQSLGGFLAIVPSEHCAALNTLAQDCVETFDAFRAPMTPQDRARRHPERLTAQQVFQLDRFGYPFVLDDFRFHMTLTERLPHHRLDAIATVLRKRFAVLALTRLSIDAIAIFRQERVDRRFQIVGCLRLVPEAATLRT